MILFNITILSDETIHEELKSWLLKDFIPKVAKDGTFNSQSLLKILNSPNEGVTYSLQFIAENQDVISHFKTNRLLSFHKKAQEEYANKVYFVESIMEFL
jgi:hypothetical protein